MNEITPRFRPLDFLRKERDAEVSKFQLALNESNARGPDGQREGPVRPQSQFFYADPNGAGGTGHGSGGTGGTSGSGGTGGTSGSGGTGGTSSTGDAHGTKEVETKNHGGQAKTVKLKDFKPPGWEDARNPEACYKLACDGASQTAPAGQNVTGGGGVILYDDKTGLGSPIIKKPAQRIHTDKDASAVALEQIKRHIDAGRAVVAGVSEPASRKIVDGPKIENGKEIPGKQPVTNHYVAVYGYETDAKGKISGLYAKDNAVPGAANIYLKVGADGSITKPAEPSRDPDDYLRLEYQLSEVKFHEGFEYKGELRPKNDDGNIMFWPHP